jgi:hypothetical protein
LLKTGGAEGSRTPDLLIANETLYQLSYDPSQCAVEYAAVIAERKENWNRPLRDVVEPAPPSTQISIAFRPGRPEVGVEITMMNSDEPSESQAPAAESQSPPPSGEGQDNRPRGGGRPRYRRGGRGRGGRGRRDPAGPPPLSEDRPRDREPGERPERENSRAAEAPSGERRQSASGIRRAIDQVLYIRTELRKALDELHEVLRTLDQAEREKNATEHEIETLRESLRGLHREPSYGRYRGGGSGGPRPVAPQPIAQPGPVDDEAEDDDEGAEVEAEAEPESESEMDDRDEQAS